jgi:RND family efflux transporter MFP subunit
MSLFNDCLEGGKELLDWFQRFRSRHRWLQGWRLVLLLVIIALLVGGHSKLRSLATLRGHAVGVIDIQQKEVPLSRDYVATTVSPQEVEIRARVEGFLLEQPFIEGADVKERDLIFVIDEQPFKAKLDEAQGQLARDEAQLTFANDQVKRYAPLAKKEYITQDDFENYQTKAKEAKAVVESDRAAVEQARLNLGYCRMYSPLSGRIGQSFVDVGNLVGAVTNTKLATIVQLDPIYVYFSPGEQEIHDILAQRAKGDLEVEILFADGTKFPHRGKVDFIDNMVDAKTSTVTMRAVVPNPEKTLLPGIYVQARLFLGTIPNAVLVPERAVAEDQVGKYVFIVNEEDVVQQQHIKLGDRFDDTRLVKEGLTPGQRVVLEGLQFVKPGLQVTPLPAGPRQVGTRDLVLRALLERPKRKHR